MLYFTAKDLLIALLLGGFLAMGLFTWTRWWFRQRWQRVKRWWQDR